jgi:hypothetical protein
MRKLVRTWWFWLVVVLLPHAVILAYLLLPLPFIESRLSQAKCDKVTLRMGTDPVYDIMKVHDLKFTRVNEIKHSGRFGAFLLQYIDEDGNRVVVTFDEEFGVMAKSFVPTERSTLRQLKDRVSRRVRALWPQTGKS